MSRKSQKRKADKADKDNITKLLHHLLSTQCHCTQKEIEIIDALLRNMMPTDDLDPLMAIYEGRVTSKREVPRIILDMEDGNVQDLTVNVNHPHLLRLEYLEEKYGHRFATLYHLAIGSTPQKLYKTLSEYCRTPLFNDIFGPHAAKEVQ